MKAWLETRCGCQRVMETTFPPSNIIIVPLKGRHADSPGQAIEVVTMECRVFGLTHWEGGPSGAAFYEEIEQ